MNRFLTIYAKRINLFLRLKKYMLFFRSWHSSWKIRGQKVITQYILVGRFRLWAGILTGPLYLL